MAWLLPSLLSLGMESHSPGWAGSWGHQSLSRQDITPVIQSELPIDLSWLHPLRQGGRTTSHLISPGSVSSSTARPYLPADMDLQACWVDICVHQHLLNEVHGLRFLYPASYFVYVCIW